MGFAEVNLPARSAHGYRLVEAEKMSNDPESEAMISQNEVRQIVRSYLPREEEAVLERIVNEIVQDAEVIIHSMVRKAAAQERDKLYGKRRR